MRAQVLTEKYPVFSPSGESEVWNAEDFWMMAMDPTHPKNKGEMGYLVSQFDFDKDWETWEIHPNGDEFVYCLSGKMTFVLESDGANKDIPLEPGQFVIVPRNTWHTAKVNEPTKALFLTWGYGTQQRKK